jgi:hypothetical protein
MCIEKFFKQTAFMMCVTAFNGNGPESGKEHPLGQIRVIKVDLKTRPRYSVKICYEVQFSATLVRVGSPVLCLSSE